MKKILIMKTIDIIANSKDGSLRIGGGINSELSTSDFNWTNLKDCEIWVENKNAERKGKLDVKKIELFPSISGKYMLGLTISSCSFDIEQEDKVFKYILE